MQFIVSQRRIMFTIIMLCLFSVLFWFGYTFLFRSSLRHCVICGEKNTFVARIIRPYGTFFISTFTPKIDVFISHHILQDGVWEPHVEETIISKFPDKCSPSQVFVDVGSNIGYFSLMMAELGCKVYSFEVQPRVIRHFQKSILLNNFENIVLTKKHYQTRLGKNLPSVFLMSIKGESRFTKGMTCGKKQMKTSLFSPQPLIPSFQRQILKFIS
jgi:FkbM family methyltransferase